MKIVIELGFSHIRDSIQAIDERLEPMRLDDARRISLTHLRNALLEGIPVDLQRLVKQPAARPLGRAAARRQFLQRQVDEQRAWIQRCGGDLAGYISHYGDPDLDRCYGDGGSKIYRADKSELDRLERELQACR